MSLLELFWPALLLMLALSLLLVPFGTEVVKRGVIFLDLAVGQWAALGAAVAMLWLHEAEWGLWVGALLGALLAASLVRFLARNAN
jgi:zinc/manganese transport system permease protein